MAKSFLCFIFTVYLKSHTMNNSVIYPEMGQSTEAEIQFRCSHGGKFIVKTTLELKGRGITLNNTGLKPGVKRNTYLVTEKAMDKLKAKYKTCFIASL